MGSMTWIIWIYLPQLFTSPSFEGDDVFSIWRYRLTASGGEVVPDWNLIANTDSELKKCCVNYTDTLTECRTVVTIRSVNTPQYIGVCSMRLISITPIEGGQLCLRFYGQDSTSRKPKTLG